MSKLHHASLCLQGQPSTSFAENAQRTALLQDSFHHMANFESPISTLVLPGGMFWHDQSLFAMTPHERCTTVQNTDWAQSIMNDVPSHMAVVTGLDISAPQAGEPHAQYSVCLTHKGVQAVSRKIFPTKGEVKQDAFTQYSDYADASRLVNTATASGLVMHTCYDLFGSVDVLSGKTKPTRLSHVSAPLGISKQQCYDAYQGMMQDNALPLNTLITVNIHDFKQPGRDIFYQRHGIASASAAFGGATVIGAAHFTSILPNSPSQSPLSAAKVPSSHLSAHFHRQAHQHHSASHMMLTTNTQRGILRVFAHS